VYVYVIDVLDWLSLVCL